MRSTGNSAKARSLVPAALAAGGNLLKGMALGMTVIVPGVSGGTIAIILGFYFDLIRAVNHFRKDVRGSLALLAPIALGAVLGIVALGSLVSRLLGDFPLPTMLFFMGMIAGIVPHVFLKAVGGSAADKPRRWVEWLPRARDLPLMILPIPLLLLMSGLRGGAAGDPAEAIAAIGLPFMLFVMLAGALAAAALVIPGVSGSFFLLLMGIYPVVMYSIRSLRPLLADLSNTALLADVARVLGPLAIGIIVGGLAMLRLIERLLERHSRPVFQLILGLMVASLFVLARDPMVSGGSPPPAAVAVGVGMAALGFAVSFLLGRRRF